MKQRILDLVASTREDLVWVALTFAAVAIPVALLLFHVHNQFRVLELGYEIAEVTREHKKLVEQNKKLRIEAAVQGRTERMTQTAQQRFGLEPARPEQLFIVEMGEPQDPRAEM